MSANFTALAYLVASVLFILALRGLSSPGAARRGNMLGIAGMAIAVGTTVLDPSIVSYGGILAAIVVGGGIGTIIAGMSFAENNRLPGVKGMPARAVLAIGAALLFRDTVGGPKNVLSFKFWIRRFAAR